MKTKSNLLLVMILAIFSVSQSAFAQGEGDPPEDPLAPISPIRSCLPVDCPDMGDLGNMFGRGSTTNMSMLSATRDKNNNRIVVDLVDNGARVRVAELSPRTKKGYRLLRRHLRKTSKDVFKSVVFTANASTSTTSTSSFAPTSSTSASKSGSIVVKGKTVHIDLKTVN